MTFEPQSPPPLFEARRGMSRVSLALTADALLWVKGGGDRLQALLAAPLTASADEHIIGDSRGRIRLSDVNWLRANKSHTDVAICHGPPFDPATDTFTFKADVARESFLTSVTESGGFERTEETYGPLRNVAAPVGAILLSFGVALVSYLDFQARGDWQPAIVAVVVALLVVGSVGWLVERLRRPAIVVLLRRRSEKRADAANEAGGDRN